MARENQKIPTSRARRTATVATLAASEAVKQFGTRAANVTRDEEASREAMSRRQLETAKQIVAVLGTMKGAAMKLGQVMSFLDVGLVAEEHRDEFQRELAKLRDAAPTVSFKQMRRVIEEDLEEPITEIFGSFEEEPIAAASIGQVYRATLRDGREVAVKVQYPGVAGAVRADLQNLEMIMRLLKRMTPGMDVKAIAEEIKERIGEELDYELEAQNQRSLARIFSGHPFIVVPDVVSSLSRERVLVSEFVSGVGFEEIKTRPQAERDRIGEIVFRFFLGCLYRHRQFSGDPHPGNFLLLEDGRVAFLDFGLFKRMDPAAVELELACQRAVVEGDSASLHELLARSGFLPEPERVDPDHLLAFIRDAIWWCSSRIAITRARRTCSSTSVTTTRSPSSTSPTSGSGPTPKCWAGFIIWRSRSTRSTGTRRGPGWRRRASSNLIESEISLYFSDPDGVRLELIAEDLGSLYGTPLH